MIATQHHAMVFEGSVEPCLIEARRFVETTFEIPWTGNPDVTVSRYPEDAFGIKDARALKERASQAPFGPAQVFVIAFESITRPAQNALLKLLEEPGDATYFILVVPNTHILLSTVRSRLAYMGRHVAETETGEADAFLKGTPAERLAILQPIIKKGDRVQARRFCDALEVYLRSHGGVEKRAPALREVAFVRSYISDPSSSPKMLLEHLVAVL